MAKSEINEIGEELNVDEFKFILVNNTISKLEKFGESTRGNIHFMRPRYVLAG